ncbi:poly [ADP-ribose] polymerase 2 isoform X2 [Latimeria chalumnae]|uniref:poly [ADP-ribose] polymerase 2 isoform X2 n=1 Tax=Latimeria chalumnae TaxID=7897 RepID=UPI0003C19742|nr:PREDICTED: poly [ADP-ribose] polymerase 2 isoform X2 [Latimeria chalumnae]|eukprot:XP_006012127.1 PREDICTED: poly [ADP-ribose] polymerase 2 isoform X2 [Latimeria chalumnae]
MRRAARRGAGDGAEEPDEAVQRGFSLAGGRQKRKLAVVKQEQECEEGDSEELELRWEWEGDDGTWNVYSDKLNEELTQEFRAGKVSCTIALNSSTKLLVDVKKMLQRNLQTSFERRVRLAVRDQDHYAVVANGSSTSSTQASGDAPTPAKRVCGSKVQKCSQSPAPGTSVQQESIETVKTLVMKGKAPVDPECKAKLGKAHVYCEGEDIYDAMLNQTNLQFNNNKYYIIQLLEDDNQKSFSVWMRWGRVGKTGQNSLVACERDLQKAKDVFKKKFLDKTKNEWDQRQVFEKVAGKYDLLQLEYGSDTKKEEEETETEQEAVKRAKLESKLDPRVQALISLICDIKTMEEMILEMKYDTKKAPLGKLTTEQIKAGYQSLKKIEDCINRNVHGRALVAACNEFYTRIPHDFGLRTPPLIRTKEELKEKLQLLEALSDIEIAIKVVKSEQKSSEHPLDRQYHSLHCSLTPLEHSSQQFKVIEKYLQSTHAKTHNDYTMTLLDVFEVDKEGEKEALRSDIENRMLLWHGSRLTNWVGILSKGLRIAPSEAPVTGYMFGKGIYFADMSSKSANYCFASRQNSVGLLLLSEVVVGECNELLAANYEGDKLPPGKHSTKGLGKVAPDPSKSITLEGVTVPMGPVKDTGVQNPDRYTLNYNEFIVYNTNQVRMKYLLKLQFNFDTLW